MELSFVDTSAWVSMADGAEATHARVAAALEHRRGRLLTTDHVLQETWMVMRHRHDRFAAETLVNAIRRGIARVEVSVLGDLEVAAEIGATFSDQDFSLSDRTCWAVMERLGITEAVSLDRDFRVYRYGPGRRKAFHIAP
ncbi:type II toxin-antitoxin system VapC family toxin [Candidatus Poriferisodalis sp.]|uniref:type II toxin-antitoxin system VapC family toxin n=1 Tax=Candidatus Poriferisodalis sp. TaxID=3101277 RepID=UPI003B0194C7